jgi:hypothetical protein
MVWYGIDKIPYHTIPFGALSPYNDCLKSPGNSCYLNDAIFFGRRSECRSGSQGPFLECLASLIQRLKACTTLLADTGQPFFPAT